jgi:hypothetical protein
MIFSAMRPATPKRNAQTENHIVAGTFHISGLANPDNLAVQTNVRASAGQKAARAA